MKRAAVVVALALSACAPEDEAPPARPAITEERDGLWLRSADGAPRRVTALRVDGFDYDSLAAKQQEGRVILYWAAAPVLAPRADRIAYATNREAVATETGGQSIWLLELGSGRERALLHERGRSFRPVGWLGDDVVVYIGDRPGVWGVDIDDGAVRLLAPGTFIAAADDGSALAIAAGVPDDVSVRVLTIDGLVDVPPPPGRFEFLAQGTFTAGGDALVLDAAADSGYTRARFRFDLSARALTEVEAASTSFPR